MEQPLDVEMIDKLKTTLEVLEERIKELDAMVKKRNAIAHALAVYLGEAVTPAGDRVSSFWFPSVTERVAQVAVSLSKDLKRPVRTAEVVKAVRERIDQPDLADLESAKVAMALFSAANRKQNPPLQKVEAGVYAANE